MSWITEGLQKRKDSLVRQREFMEDAERAFSLLRLEIEKALEEARGLGISVGGEEKSSARYNVTFYDERNTLDPYSRPKPLSTLQVVLSPDRKNVSATHNHGCSQLTAVWTGEEIAYRDENEKDVLLNSVIASEFLLKDFFFGQWSPHGILDY